ncbi:hypothetical protein [Marinibactrum halimedae]|nr:hypothetical protein [Marinibactrum halimedae]MCD9457681.1 hypothetical protein [Marinibactrum halimedae]
MAHAQTNPAPFTVKLDGSGNEKIVGSIADDDGNLYVIGYFEAGSDTHFSVYEDTDGNGTRELIAGGTELPQGDIHQLGNHRGHRDLLVAKFDWRGTLQWVKTAGGTGKDAATGIVYDRQNNLIFISGYISGTAYFDARARGAVVDGRKIDKATATNLFVANLNPDNGEWKDISVLPLQAQLQNAPSNVLLKELSLASDDDSLGKGLSLAMDVRGTDQTIALYLTGQVTNSLAMQPSATPGGNQVWNLRAGLAGKTMHNLGRAHSGGVTTSGDWAFVARVNYLDNPQAPLDQTRWEWDWLTKLDDSALPEAGAESVEVESCENQPAGRVVGRSTLTSTAVTERHITRFDPGADSNNHRIFLSEDANQLQLSQRTNFTFRDPTPPGARITHVSAKFRGELVQLPPADDHFQYGKVSVWLNVGVVRSQKIETRSTQTYEMGANHNNNNRYLYEYGGINTVSLTASYHDIWARAVSLEFTYEIDVFDPSVTKPCHTQGITSITLDPNQGLESPVYIGGHFTGQTQFSGLQTLKSEAGKANGFVASINAQGQKRYMSTVGGESSITGLVYNSASNAVMATGFVSPTSGRTADIDFRSQNTGVDITQAVTLNTELDAKTLVAKLDDNNSGRWLWANTTRNGKALAIAKDLDDNYVVTGAYLRPGEITPDPTTPLPRIVNVDGKNSGATLVELEEGFHSIERVGPLNGGQYYSVSYWSNSTCTNPNGCGHQTNTRGFFPQFFIRSNTLKKVLANYHMIDLNDTRHNIGVGRRFQDYRQALPHAVSALVRQGQTANVNFRWDDNNHSDNRGGYSLRIKSLTPDNTIRNQAPFIFGFKENADATGIESLWQKRVHSASYSQGHSVFINHLNSLYWLTGGVSNNEGSAQVPPLDAVNADTNADNVNGMGSVMSVLNPANGKHSEDFQHYTKLLVGNRVLPPNGAVISNTQLPSPFRRSIPDNLGLGAGVPTSATITNTPLLSVSKEHGVFAGGPLEKGIVVWGTSSIVQEAFQPVVGRAIKVRWPTVAEGLQEYLYSTTEGVEIPAVVLSQSNKAVAGLQYATPIESETQNDITYQPGEPIPYGIKVNEETLATEKPRLASVVFFEEGDLVGMSSFPTIVSVRSYPWDTPAKYTPNLPVDIGSTIAPLDEAMEERPGYVMSNLGRYDTLPLVYDRATRAGQIIPVNKNGPEGEDDDLLVAWYQQGALNIEWPFASSGYVPQWPAETGLIALTSQLGSEGVHKGEPQSLDGLRIALNAPELYIQNDRTQAGFNPNEEHAYMLTSGDGQFVVVHAIRHDLNHYPSGVETSDPYVLVRYQKETEDQETSYAYRIFQVAFNSADYPNFSLNAIAGQPVNLPVLQNWATSNTTAGGNPESFWQDPTNQVWSRSGDTDVAVNFFYQLPAGFDFWYDADGDGTADAVDQIAYLDIHNQNSNDDVDSAGTPFTITFTNQWPDDVPVIAIGETLIDARNNLPGVENMRNLQVVYDENDPIDVNPASAARAEQATVRLFNYRQEIQVAPTGKVQLGANESGPVIQLVSNTGEVLVNLPARIRPDLGGDYDFPRLPSDLRYRLRFRHLLNEQSGFFYFRGGKYDPTTGQDADDLPNVMHLTNVMTNFERELLKRFDNFGVSGSSDDPFLNADDVKAGTPWDVVVDKLYHQSRNPNKTDFDGDGLADEALLIGMELAREAPDDDSEELPDPILDSNGNRQLQHNLVQADVALTTAFARKPGYVVLAENADTDSDTPSTKLHIVRVVEPIAKGSVNVLRNELNLLDKRLVLRHHLDFGGRADELEFEWYWHPDVDGEPSITVGSNGAPIGWVRLQGDDISHYLDEGRPLLSDGWVLSRYRGLRTENDPEGIHWSSLSGEAVVPGDPIRPVAVSGWVKRVLEDINTFEQRYRDFHNNDVNSYTSMLVQAGRAYQGDVALNSENGNLNQIGLIELYQTILNEAIALSIQAPNAITDDDAINKQLLFAASRLADLYTLLGNEAFSDAMDPTIGQAGDGNGYLSPSLFAFEQALPSLLDEELALLRGVPRRNTLTGNRLLWNTSGGAVEATYVQVYGLSDTNGDGIEDEAQRQFPQGHGDAWGHYLTANKLYYSLARHPNYDWKPLTDTTTIAGVALQVDYQDEERFARTAAAKARTGARLVDLTFRKEYTHAPSGQWQGYKDTNAERAWGMDGWARRAGQGAFFDWALANALLPYDDSANSDTDSGTDVDRIDRQTVSELTAIPAALQEIDAIVSRADQGNNPFGLASDAIPFDISPKALREGETHFEQVYSRALQSANNSLEIFNYANALTQQIRQGQLSNAEFQRLEEDKERDFKNRLIELMGYPYQGNIGPGKVYPSGYDGPDLYQYMYIDSALPDLPESRLETVQFSLPPLTIPSGGCQRCGTGSASGFLFRRDLEEDVNGFFNLDESGNAVMQMPYYSQLSSYAFVAPHSWESRRAPGKLQLQLGEIQSVQARLNSATADNQVLLEQIQAEVDLLESIYQIRGDEILVLNKNSSSNYVLTNKLADMRAAAELSTLAGEAVYRLAGPVLAGFSGAAGMSFDPTFPVRAAFGSVSGSFAAAGVLTGGIIGGNAMNEQARVEDLAFSNSIFIEKSSFKIELKQQLTVIENLIHEALQKQHSVVELLQEMENAKGVYQQLVAEAVRVMEERIAFRKEVASRTTDERYRDMTYRVFRNDALQKYRASFDLAARYTYLAAKAFDYETGLLSDSVEDQSFYESLVKERSLGQFDGSGLPVAGVQGLSTPLARMQQVYTGAESRYGLLDPLNEEHHFSLRREAFRILEGDSGRERWQSMLQNARVDDLWDLPEFREFCVAPGVSPADGQLPGLVLRFGTSIQNGKNLFGWQAGAGDAIYSASRSATKLYRVGLHFDNYPTDSLIRTPYAYLVPVGTDVMRSPEDITQLRFYQVLDQSIPVPTDLVQANDTYTDDDWIPQLDVLGNWADRRRHSQMPVNTQAHFNFDDVTTDGRLVGRSVWNTEWVLIIPSQSLLGGTNGEGLEVFINGANGGEGVSDIRLVFDTYSFTGS